MQSGDFAVVRYAVPGPVVYHVRLLVTLAQGGGASSWHVVTPDGDEYVEDLIVNPDINYVGLCSHWSGYPVGVPPANVYDFAAPPSRAIFLGYIANAFVTMGVDPTPADLAATPRTAPPVPVPAAPAVGGGVAGGVGALAVALGLPPAAPAAGVLGAPPLPGPAAPPAAAAAGVAAAPGPPGVLGAPPPVAAGGPAAAVIPVVPPALGYAAPAALAPAPAAPIAPAIDVRVTVPAYDMLGKRHRECRDCLHLLFESPFPDWPIPGPRTVLWVVSFMVHLAGSPVGWFTKFKSDMGLTFTDDGIEELERLCKQLQTWIVYDQYNVCNSAAAEMVSRSIQVICGSYSERLQTGREDYFERGVLYGTEGMDGLLPLCPALKDHLAAELQKRNSIEKEKRRAQELRIASNANRGGGRNRRGRGRGKDDAPTGDG